MLVYIPHCLSFGTIAEMDIIHNCFHSTEPYDHLITYKENIKNPTDFKLLKHIAFFKLMGNFPKLKRQDIPRPLWEYFNYVGRCANCRRWTLPDYSRTTRIKFRPLIKKINMALHLYEEGPTWQLMYCTDKKDCDAHKKYIRVNC